MQKRLTSYEQKRDFSVTSEPAPGSGERPSGQSAAPTFVVHKHDATRLHYDLRLEMDGALASWSVPKGPAYDPAVKRLAIETEDHPLEYGKFEGRIPDGEYGAGDSLIWDAGTYQSIPPGEASAQRKKGRLHFKLEGQKLRGEWHLVRTRPQGSKAQWLLFKAKDGAEDAGYDVVAARPESVVSGRTLTRGPERKGTLRAARPGPEKLLEGALPPMLATLIDEPPGEGEEYQLELKVDGYRALCALSNGRVAMQTRNGLDLNGRYPAIARALGKLVVGDALIDAEIAVPDAKGVPRFELLQQGHEEDALLFAFDLLRLDGADLRERPLEERRQLLESLLANSPANLRLVERLAGPPERALEEMRARGVEGVMLKRKGSPYAQGRSRDWLKLKVLASQELAIVGYLPGKGALEHGLGALLLAVREEPGPAGSDRGAWVFAGKVGTGFSAKERKELARTLEKEPAGEGPRGAPRLQKAQWVRPRLVAQVRFTEWTRDGKLRHPSFQGLRKDKTPEECVREEPKAPPGEQGAKSAKPARKRGKSAKSEEPGREPASAAPGSGPTGQIALTNPARLLYPADGVTKQDVADYYAAVQEPLLRALAGRPLALIHWNQGIAKPSWFQQNFAGDAPGYLRTVETPAQTARGSVRHLVADGPASLRWLAQHSVLELHPWHSREGSLTMPDWVVFDLDPAEGQNLEQAIPVALLLHDMLDRLGLPSLPKTSGKRGLHVFVPLAPGHTYEDAQTFALRVGETLAAQLPEVTLERGKAKRKGRLYFDTVQNGYGKTVVGAYSLRGAPGAPVSTPLRWSEVQPGLDPLGFNLRTLPKRLDKVGDLFAPAITQGVRLPRYK